MLLTDHWKIDYDQSMFFFSRTLKSARNAGMARGERRDARNEGVHCPNLDCLRDLLSSNKHWKINVNQRYDFLFKKSPFLVGYSYNSSIIFIYGSTVKSINQIRALSSKNNLRSTESLKYNSVVSKPTLNQSILFLRKSSLSSEIKFFERI